MYIVTIGLIIIKWENNEKKLWNQNRGIIKVILEDIIYKS